MSLVATYIVDVVLDKNVLAAKPVLGIVSAIKVYTGVSPQDGV